MNDGAGARVYWAVIVACLGSLLPAVAFRRCLNRLILTLCPFRAWPTPQTDTFPRRASMTPGPATTFSYLRAKRASVRRPASSRDSDRSSRPAVPSVEVSVQRPMRPNPVNRAPTKQPPRGRAGSLRKVAPGLLRRTWLVQLPRPRARTQIPRPPTSNPKAIVTVSLCGLPDRTRFFRCSQLNVMGL